MVRFEELQMAIAESARKHLQILSMQVFIEQFSLERESRMTVAMPEMDTLPYSLTGIVSFTYDVIQSGATIYKDPFEEKDDDDEDDDDDEVSDNFIEINLTVKLPILYGDPDLESLTKELQEEFPDIEPFLLKKHITGPEEDITEYELSYFYEIETDDVDDTEIFDEIFSELREIMSMTHEKTKRYIDRSWYEEQD
ncbi:MAG: hypothetical protein RBT37_09555 [Dissulfurispiraceae bacterium]|jgi:hypothetical protein|nr:hypothetical protein [Dissulfurispiraceae bacterium]